LTPVACDNDAVAPLGAARVQFAAMKGRAYAVVVASVNGARGLAQLNYHLDPSIPPQPPMLLENPMPRTAAAGDWVILSLSVSGSPPLRFTWSKDGASLSNAETSSLLLSNVTPNVSGNYMVTVNNDVGPPISATLPLRVVVRPLFDFLPSFNGLSLNLSTVPGQNYIVEETAELGGTWLPWPNTILGDGSPVLLQITNLFEPGPKFFRIRVE
jgi:hypothetical protein